MLDFPDKISLAQLPTPLQPLDRLSKALGGPRIWLKRDDLTGNLLSGNKVRKLEYVVADAKAQGANTLITCGGTQSNHCRATAFVAAQLGLKCHLILRQDPLPSGDSNTADGNLMLDDLAGASVDVYPAVGFASKLKSRLASAKERYLEAGDRPYCIPVGASDGVGIWGYISAAGELQADFDKAGISPRTIVCTTGSGGTQAGLTVGMAALGELRESAPKVLGFAVCDNAEYFHAKVKSDIAQWRRVYPGQAQGVTFTTHVNDKYVGAGYAKACDHVLDTIAWVARTEGVLFDPVYTGKAFAGLIDEIKQGAFTGESDIVFIHTGGTFGVFPWRQRFSDLKNI